MAQTSSPFFNIQYGWELGSSGWGDPLNTNLQVMSFLDKGAVDDFVGVLPGSPANGDSVVYTVDNQLYFRIGGNWLFVAPEEGMEVNETSTGKKWYFNGTSWTEIPNTTALDTRLDAIEADYTTSTELSTAISNHEAASNPHPVYLTQTEGDGLYSAFVLNNSTTTNPTAADDSGDGYAPFSKWINTSTQHIWMCVDASVGAAVWKQITN